MLYNNILGHYSYYSYHIYTHIFYAQRGRQSFFKRQLPHIVYLLCCGELYKQTPNDTEQLLLPGFGYGETSVMFLQHNGRILRPGELIMSCEPRPYVYAIGLRISILRCYILCSCSVVHYSVIKWIFGRWCCSMFLLRCMWKSSQYPQCCPMWDWNPQYLATYKPSRWPPSLGHTLSFKIIPLQFAKCNFIRVIGGKFFAALRYFFFSNILINITKLNTSYALLNKS